MKKQRSESAADRTAAPSGQTSGLDTGHGTTLPPRLQLTDEDRRRDLAARWYAFLAMIYDQADASVESYNSKL